jgi:hypothetical protein
MPVEVILDLGARRDVNEVGPPLSRPGRLRDATAVPRGPTSGSITRDIGWVRCPNPDEKAFPHSDIRPPFDTDAAGPSETGEAMADELVQFVARASFRDRDDQFLLSRRQL